jgi:hypothetical protein
MALAVVRCSAEKAAMAGGTGAYRAAAARPALRAGRAARDSILAED